jgi:hypothetical protein
MVGVMLKTYQLFAVQLPVRLIDVVSCWVLTLAQQPL